MPRKDPEKRREYQREYQRGYNAANPEKAAEKARRWREKHRDHYNAYQRSWRQANLEEQREKQRAYYHEHKEELRAKRSTAEQLEKRRAYYQAHKEEMAAKARAFRAKKKAEKEKLAAVAAAAEERSDEMGLKTEKCPLCKSAASAKLKGVVYLAGCLNKKCRKWIDGDESETGATMAGAIGNWNKWVEEELKAIAAEEEADRIAAELEKQDAENGPPAPEDPDEDLDVDLPEDEGEPDEPEEPEEQEEPEEPEEPEDDGEPESGEGEEAGEDDEETFARFWLELDGTWYWLDGREDEDSPCDGCAFCLAFGRRTFCAAASSEDFSEASELCKRLEGVWKKNEE